MNPSKSKVTSAQQTSLPSNSSTNNPKAYNPQGYNTFDRDADHVTTTRFQDVKPFYCSPEIEGNNARLQTAHNLRTPIMKSPKYSNIYLDKSFYQVPWSSIAPKTWEYLYRQPARGEDIVWSEVHQSVSISHLLKAIKSILGIYDGSYSGATSTRNFELAQLYSGLIPAILAANTVIGNDTLLKSIGTSLPAESLIDDLYGALVSSIFEQLHYEESEIPGALISLRSLEFTTRDGVVYFLDENSSISDICQWMEDLKFYSSELASMTNTTNTDTVSIIIEPVDIGLMKQAYFYDGYDFDGVVYSAEEIRDYLPATWNLLDLLGSATSVLTTYQNVDESVTVDLMRCVAYQQICYQYFTNSLVDDVFTGRQFNENVLSMCFNNDQLMTDSLHMPYYDLIMNLDQGQRTALAKTRSFQLNGIMIDYDAYSNKFMNTLHNGIYFSAGTQFSTGNFPLFVKATRVSMAYLAFVQDLFGIHRSLRNGDYFVSSRTRPLGVGDVTYEVNSNRVSVIDTNKALWWQRLLNAVNRIPANIYEYIKQMAGVVPERMEPQPNFLINEMYMIHGTEVENTADDQGNIVTLGRSSDGRFMYEAYIDEPSFVIGVVSFVVKNIYPQSSSRITFMNDRFDWFNHFLQHVGDQDVQMRELLVPDKAANYIDTPISYQLRYAEFKSAVSRASGAFSKGTLDSWVVMPEYFNSANREDYSAKTLNEVVLSPYFIRNKNSDFDKLFASLTATNNADRYHFVIGHFINDKVNSRQAKFPSLDV